MTERRAEVIIVGGGMVGMCLAVALADAGVATALVERARMADLAEPERDGRASAIAAGSQRILDGLGLWQAIAPHAQPIHGIRVADGASPLFLHFDEDELAEGPLGWIVENTAIRQALGHAVTGADLLVADGRQVTKVEYGTRRAHVLLDDGNSLAARLVIAADGRNSPLRAAAGIDAVRWSYPQTAIVCSVDHELSHDGIAHEHFLPPGPFAILPMTGNRSSIVWTEEAARARAILSLDDAGFAEQLRLRFGSFLGQLSPGSGRWHHPLSAILARSFTGHRLALAGDAAHAIHPIAGQGLNLGLRDIAALAEIVTDTLRVGLDPGLEPALARYQKWRRSDNLAMLAVTDALNRLFANEIPAVRLARDLGLGIVHRTRPLKKLFMRQAMGLAGDLPRLASGKPL